MSDPNLALWLYISIIFVQFLASPTWGRVRTVITDATKAKAAVSDGNTQTSGAGTQTH
jgi:hypothetical protein